MAQTYTTNASLPKPTDVNVIHDDMDLLKLAHSTAMDVLESLLCGTTTVTCNTSNSNIVATAGKPIVKLQIVSIAGSLTTITGAVAYRPFTLMVISGASCGNQGLDDKAPFKLTAKWFPNDIGNNITLVWDGTSFVEIGRSAST
jgi:hypothetical protein